MRSTLTPTESTPNRSTSYEINRNLFIWVHVQMSGYMQYYWVYTMTKVQFDVLLRLYTQLGYFHHSESVQLKKFAIFSWLGCILLQLLAPSWWHPQAQKYLPWTWFAHNLLQSQVPAFNMIICSGHSSCSIIPNVLTVCPPPPTTRLGAHARGITEYS